VVCVTPPSCTSPPMYPQASVPEDVADYSSSGSTSSLLPTIMVPCARYATSCPSLSQWFASPEAGGLCQLPLADDATAFLSPLLDLTQSFNSKAENTEFPNEEDVQIQHIWSLNDIPSDIGLWSPDELRETNISPMGSDSEWSSTSSCDRSVSPETPAVNGEPFVIRIKRKSVECVSDDEDDALEKRPKFERKEWVLSIQQRRNILPMRK